MVSNQIKGVIYISSTLSLCIISKNEEKNITRCINSVSNICDEIIVVDTGSTDSTVDICKTLGATVIFHKWNNNFSEARNLSISYATKDWILFLDCDEALSHDHVNTIKSLIDSNPQSEAIYFKLLNIINEKILSTATVLRAFKNRPEYRFSGKIHEQIIHSIENLYGKDSIIESDIKILHYGYDPNVYTPESKTNRNLEILISYDEADRDGYYYYALGNEYARIKKFNLALTNYKESLKKSPFPIDKYVYYPSLTISLCKLLYSNHKYYECLKYIDIFKDNLNDFKDLYFIQCLCHIAISKITYALKSLEKYRSITSHSYKYPTNNYGDSKDLDKLEFDLKSRCIPHTDIMLTVWITLNETNDNITDCIKSVNEISDDVIVITNNIVKIPIENIQNSGGRILNIEPQDSINTFNIAMKNSYSDYILLLSPDEIVSYKSQIQLSNLLLGDNLKDGYILNTIDTMSNKQYKKFSLFKKNIEIMSLESYYTHLISNFSTPPLTNILIHKI